MDEKIGPVGEEKPSPSQDNTRDPRETLPRLESTSTCTQSGDSLKAQDLSPTTQLVNAAILESLYELQLAGEISLYSSDSDLNRSQLEPILEEEGSVISEDNLDKERRQSVLDEGIAPPVAEPSETPRTTQIVNSEECVDKYQNHIEKDSVSGSEATREDLGGKNPEDTVQDSGQASGDHKEEDLEVSEKTESGLGRSVETSEQLETATPDPDSEATQPSQDLESEAAEVDKSGGDNSDECCQAVKSDTLGKSERVGDSPGPRAELPRSVEGSFREGTETSDVVNDNLRSVEKLPEHNSKDTAKEKEDFPDGKDNVTGVETESKETTQADSKKPPPNTMGSGASKDGEFVEDGQDRQYAQRSMAPISGMSPSGSQITQRSGSPLKRKGSSLSRHLSKSQLGISGLPPSVSHFSSSVSKFIGSDGYEEAIVRITKVGFSLPEITIMEGQSITFVWEERVSMIQVIYDGEKLRPVIGGYQASPDETDGQYELQFNLEGEYKFALNGVRCTPLAVLVRRRMDLQAVVTDEGFSPDIIEIFQGHTVKWSWKQCAVPHTIKEVILCMDRGSFRKQPTNASVVATVSGSYRHTFQRPGLYYFQTESIELGRTHLCVVQVREAPREHKIEILDRSFQPMILLIEEGDRVWFYWDKHKCKKHHSIYQVEAPSIDLDEDEPYIPIKDGFRWTVPSKQGMLSHEFHKTGVYYFSDQNFEEAAEYLGTIIVKPRPKEHHIELKEKGFSPDLLFANTGDRIWWTWDGEGIVNVNETLLVLEEDKCLNPIARRPSAETEAYSAEMYIDLDEASMKLLTRVGHATYHFTTIGVYNFRVADTGDSFTTCSVVVNPGSRNHTVHLTDNGFEPKVITIRPNDRVWWVWQSGKKQHNIIQVSHQGVPITNGFCSGQTRDSPSAFTHQFIMPGVFYFISKNLPKVFGAVVVSTQPQVHEISVTSSEIKPDPVVIQVNDIVAWTFRNPRTFDVALVETVDQVLDAHFSEKVLTPRRCIPRALTTTGIKHYHSKSFQKQKSKQNFMAETKLSSVIADERYDNEVIRVDNQGFHPAQLFLQKGQSVLWTWKGSDIPHNIIHVNSPNSDNPLNVIQGAQSFNSGKPVANNSFLYTFDEEGAYTVASQGAPGFACTISVMDVAPRCPEPRITSDSNGGTVNRYSIVKLACSLDGTSIYYTIDGSLPALHSDATKRYKPEQGVILRDSGLSFVRAMAVIDGYLNSHIFTSNRFWVLTREEEGEGVPEDSLTEDIQDKQETSTSAWNWWNCCPTIKGCFTAPGVMELFWEKPSEGAQHLVKGYQVFLNGVTYCEMFPKDNNSINISGMAGNRLYEVYVEVYPKRSTEEPQKSNKLRMRCPSTTPEGGPVISVEVSEKSDALTIVWMSMDTPEVPIDGYLVFLDDQQCGPKLVPDEDSNRCKVIVGSCELDKTYKIYVLALLKGVDETRMSNILEVELPLDKTQIILPGEDQRLEDDEVYQEYLEIHEGSGYLPEMDKSPTEDVDGRKGEKVDTSPPVMLDASTLEEKNQHASTLPPKVIEVETRDDSDDQGVMTDDNLEKSTQTRRGRGKQGQRFDDSPLPQSLIEQSESESESESEFESEEEDFPRNNVVILDATKNQATDSGRTEKKRTSRPRRPADSTQSSPRKRFSPRDGKYIEPEDNLLVTHPDERQPKRKRTMAIVEVQQQVELDVDRVEVQGSSDRPDRKLAVPGAHEGASMMQIGEGEFILGDGDGILPAPSIMVESRGKNGVKVAWELPKSVDSQYKLLLYVVNVVGTKFTSDINSDISFECNLVEKGKPVRGVQHCWNISDKQKCTLRGLVPGLTYRVYVIANYSMVHGQQACEIQTTSSVIYYTTMGPPKPPKIKIVSVDLYQAIAEWDPPSVHPDLKLKGYQIYVDNKPLGGVRSSDVRQMVINNLIPGKTLSVYVVAITSRASQESEPSRTMHITCPRRPPAVAISQQPSYKKGCVLVAWDKPRYTHASNDEEISLYSIYIDGHWHGEVKANKMSDKQGYQFFLTDLSPEQPYDISIRAICGTRRVDSDAQHVYCLSDSGMSNIVPVMAPAAPKSPKLRLEGLHPDGIDCTWQVPQQFGDASISGYQMLKNGKLYGSIIPPDVNSLRIRDMMLGEKVQLQLIALTEHPVGKDTRKSLDGDSGIEGGLSQPDERITATAPEPHKLIFHAHDDPTADLPASVKDVFTGDRYSGCKPGPKLVVHYTGLVQPPREVWCEQVTGHSALIVWNTDFEAKAHFIRPDCYQVTWWPGDRPEEEINSDSTTEDHLLITSLRPCTSYTVVVEARKMEKYTDIDEGTCTTETPDGLNAFILTSKSDQLAVKTASPPDAPRNLGVIATTCNSLKVAWDPPQEHGVEVIAMRIECVSLNANDPHHVSVDTMPDAKMAIVDHLLEKTDYLVRIVAVTDEYFDRLPDKHKYKKHRSIPKETMISPDDSVWLPNASILSKTAGTEPPTNIKVVQSSTTSLRLSWTPPLVYGSNKLQGQIIRWADVKKGRLKDEDLVVASHVNLLATEDSLTIDDLSPGAHYRIVIEAVVSIKTSLDPDKWDSGIEKYRRTAHVMSRALMARTRAPIEPPRLLVSSYTQNTANLYWEKPPLMSVIGKDEDGRPIYLRRYLEGYKLEINGKLQCCLGPAAQSCTLTKCKPGKKYDVTLVALTCTEDAKKERKQKYKGFFKNTNPQDLDYATILDDPESLDEAPSDSVEVTLPKNQEGFISTLTSEFLHQSERDNKTFGDVVLSWTTQGQITPLKQFNVVWYCEDRVIQTKYVQPTQMQCTIPITKIKATYTITVEPVYFTDVIPQTAQEIQIMIPGPPDAPEIFLRTVEPEEFIIEWGEPKLYGGIRIKGYQVYLNDKKAGNELSSSHRKAVIPCRPNRTYKINLVALSSNPEYMDSPKSNGLLVNTSSSSPRPGESSLSLEDWSSTADDHEISLKVTRISENSIHLDWSTFLETEGVTFYKIQWSSVAQPAQREVRLSERDTNCVINKCLPGTTHFVRLVAYSEDGQIMDKSKQLTVQTSAPPDGPVLSIRACNFRYIAIQWDKPNTYGDALVTGYKVYVNGIVEAILNADQLSFTFTHGKWCQEYSFQVQALTATERLNSKPSEPLVVPWPGVKPPAIFRIPSVSSSTLRVGWEAPYMTEGIKVKHYRLCCVEEDTEKLVQSIGPIHPDTREAEFKHLKKGNYSVYLETHLYGTSDVVRSEMIRMQPALSPDPPVISSTIAGLEERRQIEKITCDLVNKRDRLIRAVGHKLKKIGALAHPIRAEKNDDIILGAHTLTRVEELLEDCFNALEQYTGHLIAHVSWQCPQSNPDMVISSYKVLIDGKQYGNAMHSGVKTVRIKLGLEQSNYKLSLVSMSEKPQGTSEESNTVELLATPFKPFSFYCYHAIHNKDTTWPSYGCCKYQDSIMYERQVAKKLANQGLLQKHVPPPACSLLDVFDGVFKPLMGAHKPQHPTVLLFWTPWCLPSQQIMSFYTRFARETAKEFTFVAVTCGMSGVSVADRKSLIHLITSNGWREDGMVWHCTNECASNVYEAANNVRKTPTGMRLESDLEGERQMELTELLGIAGVPTFLFLHPDGYIAWHGRYSAYDYASFSAFMRHTMSEVLHQPCPVYNCDCCKNDMTLDDELFNSGLIFTNENSRHGSPKNVTIMLGKDDPTLPVPGSKHSPSHELKYVPHNGYADNAAGTDRVFLRRKHSPKRKKTRISVNSRPFSASASVSPPQLQNSPYLARLRPTSPRSYRTRNRPVSANRLNHYV
ncbi:uncharacterized protein LOC124136325 [Haliotis rufescens]|uniref:uncharacterized protein LOC124136325 n=1 Tax=Haliotis rufescens TaxID=6454 RepID=UPI00201F8395|nr:uncharacterized protein LOC124136325 [Haliotis rufescens]